MTVNGRTTALTFAAPELLNDMFTGTVVVTVTAINRYGKGPASEPKDAVITGNVN